MRKYLNKLNVWIPVIGYEGIYEIFSDGRVRSVDRLVNGHNGKKPRYGKTCKPFFRNDYLGFSLSKNGFAKQYSVHRLLGVHYLPNPLNKKTVNHLDGNKVNNSLENLEWATHSEQLLHANRTGLFKSIPPTKKGDKLSMSTRAKMSKSRTGKVMSPVTRKKISESLKRYNSVTPKKDL